MCVHVFASRLPDDTLVWVDRQQQHTLIYVDPSLVDGSQLTSRGRETVDSALRAAGAGTLHAATKCSRPPLWSDAN
ncbi:hypothetical protein GA0115257_11545 [Streptomyces sp. LcepLS]|nr:hypothetical protein GA0115257_11545 [Streptomyces sp. LcepLS]